MPENCDLCGADDALDALIVPPRDAAIVACGICRGQIAGADELDAKHWFCLQDAAWSENPAVQVVSYRLLGRLDAAWATDLLETLYLDEDTLAWAQVVDDAEVEVKTVDSNGVELFDGDSVTLIKDLDVKGANFTAKRGTLVRNIRVGSDPELVEGRVNKTSIYLKTCFLKKVH